MAMLGLTLGALLVFAAKGWFDKFKLNEVLSLFTTILSLTIAISLVFFLTSIVTAGTNLFINLIVWGNLVVILALPYILAGIVISLALTRPRLPIGKIYAVDLFGASGGCFAVLLLLNFMDGVSAVFALCTLTALAAILFANGLNQAAQAKGNSLPTALDRFTKKLPLRLLVLFALVTGINASFYPNSARLIVEKQKLATPSEQEGIYWNSFSRVDVSKPFLGTAGLHGPGSLITFDDLPIINTRDLRMDAGANTLIYEFSLGETDLSFLEYDVVNIGYFATDGGRAAVIGVGGGQDILSAHYFGFDEITGVEINPIFIDLLENRYRSISPIADLPGVELVVDEARAWFASNQQVFDSIQMSLIDTWAATGVGAYSLTENGLYTIEAWTHFLSRLNNGGVFTVARWFAPNNPGEAGRTISLAKATLFGMGVENPDAHIALIASEQLATIVVGRDALTPKQISSMKEAADRIGFQVVYEPGIEPENQILREIKSAQSVAELNELAKHATLNFSPPTDSTPFFFNQLPASSLLNPFELQKQIASGDGVLSGNIYATIVLLCIIIISAASVYFTAVLPARSSILNVEKNLAMYGTLFFLLIGLGFMFVEIALMQRLSIFLGHPVYGLAIALAGIILSTGIGSALSERFPLKLRSNIYLWTAGTAIYLALFPIWLPSLVQIFDTSGITVRSLVSLLVVFPAGLLMGYGFPTGMRLVSAINGTPTPWFWAVNGAAGVLASGLAIFVGTTTSINNNFFIGAACYALLAPLAISLLRTAQEKV